ncbi:TPA: SpaA isopeptide-forming pilin-related protein [Listeria monocytogenes]|uniref:LPXTG cell wall anchor domain-containing protein n=1 Tax=Listeria monocytogenes TaxID=1639 RepID=UPI0018E57F47|nr:LPXTG cell wall anchor domain-containing protein [Listeria monocytogenes]EHC6210342.1 LPXTG cell wall anchor domain-containing protein [Listeria monocytogenes serotype 1/2b]EGI0425464.1 LPXTG cell wall anchor domain-containing protein [Listeria monocytogenes]EGI0444407.1 LPXTG cell wall anchor domain-containing protein [Listeria monocytogenes]EJE1078616.1 LPXTG cell wall anchor domain-containing protein [Listeria monocytogenes]EJE1830317.1 LPXTG cell wall anchor domain-containing protein [L
MVHNLANKTFKMVLATLLVFSAVFTYVTNVFPEKVSAATTTKVSIVSKNVTYLHGPNSGTPVRMIDRLRNSDNQVVFCINFNLPSPNGLTYNEAEKLDNATSYLLNAFYKGNKNLTGNKAYDEYLIQGAIHNIKSPNAFSLTNVAGQLYVDSDGSHKTANKIKVLVAEAKKAGSPSTPAFNNELKVSNGTVNATLKDNKFVSAPVTVTVKGNGTIVSKLTAGTKNSYIGDEQGNPIKEIKNGTKVTIVVPATDLNGQALNPKVEISGVFEQAYQVAKRLTGQSAYQDIATYGLEKFNEKKTASFTTNIQAVTGSVAGVKITDSKKPLQGAKIEVRNANDTLVKAITTAQDGLWGASNLPFGEYYWLETGTVDGYVLNGEKHPFTIDYNHVNVNAGDFVNKLKRGSIEGVKVDAETNKALAGAEFTLTDNEGQKQVVTTTNDGMFKFQLEGGKTYTLEETKNPKGYSGQYKQEGITLSNDGQVIKVKAENMKHVVVNHTKTVEKTGTLVKTGDSMNIWCVVAGFALLAVGVFLFARNRKSKDAK